MTGPFEGSGGLSEAAFLAEGHRSTRHRGRAPLRRRLSRRRRGEKVSQHRRDTRRVERASSLADARSRSGRRATRSPVTRKSARSRFADACRRDSDRRRVICGLARRGSLASAPQIRSLFVSRGLSWSVFARGGWCPCLVALTPPSSEPHTRSSARRQSPSYGRFARRAASRARATSTLPSHR